MLPQPQLKTPVEYPESDDEPIGETGFHVTLITYLLSMLREYFRDRTDVYVGANMFVYYAEGDPTKKFAPDIFVAFGASKDERRIWKTWEEGTGPDVIFEVTSKSTQSEDLGTKKGLYEWLEVQEYFLFDPLGEYLKPALRGFRLTDDGYRETEPVITDGRLQLHSEALGLLLRTAGDELHLVEQAAGERLLPPPELADALREAHNKLREEAAGRQAAEARARALEAELEQAHAELAQLRGEQNS